MRSVLLSTTILAYFNPLPQVYTEIVADASSMSLGAVILQQQCDGTLEQLFMPVESAAQSKDEFEREAPAIYLQLTFPKLFM